MKTIKQKIFLAIVLVILFVFGIEIFSGYMSNHTYYASMLHNSKNIWMIVWALLSASIPLLYLIFHKSFKLKKFMIFVLLALMIFGFAHVILKG
ncbi:MAG: hypothetical protein GXP45_05390 [bacterium]|nr:hypothetical protein [bacterium]